MHTEKIKRCEGETQEDFMQRHANLLNVSVAVLDAHYNRFEIAHVLVYVWVLLGLDLSNTHTHTHTPRHNLAQEYEDTLTSVNADLNLGPEEEGVNEELNARMKGHIKEADKTAAPSPSPRVRVK